MAAGFRSKSATFNAAAITNITRITDNLSGQVVDLITDGNLNIEDVFLDARAIDVTIETSDFANGTLVPGATAAALAITYEKRADGSAAAGSGNKILTIANAVLVSNDGGAGTTGVGSRSLRFRGPGPGVWS